MTGRIPSGADMAKVMPVMQWFRVPVEVKKNFPEIEDWDRTRAYNVLLRHLNKLVKWGKAAKSGSGSLIFWCI